MTRKPPVRHTVKSHTRKGKHINSFSRGRGGQKILKKRVVGRFGEQRLFKLPTHNVMVVTGLAQEGEPRSRIICRVATENPIEAVMIANVLLREEFGFVNGLYNADVFNTPTEARLKSVSWRHEDIPDLPSMDKAFFNVMHEFPLYYKSKTDEVKEFWQDISYASGVG